MLNKESAFWQSTATIKLNEVQKQAVAMTEGALLLLAAPGSGKTTTMIMKIGYLITVKDVTADKIKAVTFSRAAAWEMKKRFESFFPKLDVVDFSTIHSLAFEIARKYFRKNKIKYQLIEGSKNQDKRHILRDIFKSLVKENITEDQMEELLTYISYIKNKLIHTDQWSDVECNIKQAHKIMAKYEAFKNNSDVLLLDYDDLLIYANKALDDAELLKYYQNLYDYVLTDESQDTSLVQHYIIEKMVQKHGNLCVVADDDQAIYSWRGAEPAYLMEFKKVYPEASVLYMEQNYRSSKDIVTVANSFIKWNKNRYEKNMFTENDFYKPIVIKKLSDYKRQAKYLIDAISNSEAGVAILYRNNSSSIILVNELEIAGISFYIKDDDKKFFKHWVVEDVLNFMRLAYLNRSVTVFERIYTKINGYISTRQMEQLKSINNNESVFINLLNNIQLESYQYKYIQECQDIFLKMKEMKPSIIIYTIRHRLGYEKALERICSRLGFKKEYLLGILNTLEEIAEGINTMEEFVGRLNYLESVIKTAKNNRTAKVTLSTFHSAKGLEFENVYMIDLLEGIIPATTDIEQYKKGKEKAIEEARRLFYVGMTRAKNKLELISYEKRDNEKVFESQFVTAVRKIVNPQEIANSRLKNMSLAKKKNDIMVNPNGIKNIADLKVGNNIKHAKFGVGKIIAITNSDIEIDFYGNTKKLLLEVCINKGFLELEEM